MADFKIAIQKTLIHEGGYVNDPRDAGGETYKGVARVDHPNWSGWQIIDEFKNVPNFPRNLESNTTLQQLVVKIYTDGYWKDLYSQIDNQLIADKLFDMGVLFGVGTAVKMLQLSLSNGITVVSDGAFGPNTLAAVNDHGDLEKYKRVLLNHCVNVVNNNPEDSVFVKGWINRIQS